MSGKRVPLAGTVFGVSAEFKSIVSNGIKTIKKLLSHSQKSG